MPPTKGGKRPPKGGKGSAAGSGKGKRAGSGKGQPNKSGSVGGSKKSGRKAARGGGKKKNTRQWSSFIHKTLKQLHKSFTISSRAMTIMGSFVEDMFERIHTEAVSIAKINKIKTLTAREVQTAARLLLPKELAKHAMSEGTKAVSKYNLAVQAQQEARMPATL